MNCRKVLKKINRYMDNELSASQAAAVDEHLRACRDCREAMARHAGIAAVLNTLELPEPPADFPLRVRLAAEKRSEAAKQKVVAFPRLHTMPAASRAAAAVVLFLGLALGALSGHSAYRHAWRTAYAGNDLFAGELFRTIPGDEISGTYLAFMGYEDVE